LLNVLVLYIYDFFSVFSVSKKADSCRSLYENEHCAH